MPSSKSTNIFLLYAKLCSSVVRYPTSNTGVASSSPVLVTVFSYVIDANGSHVEGLKKKKEDKEDEEEDADDS